MRIYLEKPLGTISDAELKKLISSKINWGVQYAVAVPFLTWFPEISFTEGLPKYTTFGPRALLTIFDREPAEWRFDNEKLINDVKEILLREAKGEKIVLPIYRRWQRAEKDYLIQWKKTLQQIKHLASLSLQSLWASFLNFCDYYLKEYSPALLCDEISAYSDFLIEEISKNKPSLVTAATTLTLPAEKGFFQREEEDLLKIALECPDNQSAVIAHQKKYFWIHNNYKDTEPLPVGYFQKRINEFLKKGIAEKQFVKLRTRFQETQKTRKEIIKKKIFDKNTLHALLTISFSAGWQDKRKQYNLMANYILNEFLKEFSKRSKIEFALLQYAIPWEIKQILFENKNYFPTLKRRIEGFGRLSMPGKELLAEGTKFRLILKLCEEKIRKEKEIKGLVASPGKTRGRVKIVLNPKAVTDFKKRDILIAPMTRPDYLPLIKKASAVITDEGGITCHAAIISRELGIPCVVGTKIATKVLKDGDIIELDAEKGIVRKISD